MKTNTFKNLKFLKLLFIVITLSTFNSISAQERATQPNGSKLIYRDGYKTTIPINTYNTDVKQLVVYQGDKVVFEALGSNPSVKGLTDTNVMRWAG